ncbi:MAG: hypothetical protein BGO98_03920 [Myxococcales bacterium 68-20]|nr:MAG: hypothetical protein BGO98_03920 [Myxococcales bacterium 68-20]
MNVRFDTSEIIYRSKRPRVRGWNVWSVLAWAARRRRLGSELIARSGSTIGATRSIEQNARRC